jgi:hypothetical protein
VRESYLRFKIGSQVVNDTSLFPETGARLHLPSQFLMIQK